MSHSFEAQAHLAAIIQSSDDAIVSKDLNGIILSWNPGAERIFGYTAQEAIGRHIGLIIPPERMHEEEYIISEISKGNRLEHFEAIRRAKDGRMLTLSVTVSPIKNAEGMIVGASKVARDITEQKNNESLSAYHAAIIANSDDAIISKDLNGFITSWNPGAECIFGYTASEVIGRHITIVIPAERLAEEEKILADLKSGGRVDHFETIRRHKNGKQIPVSITVSPIRDKNGHIIGASKIARDISERIHAAEALMELARKKDDFLANMSHELRTPMNAVNGLANLLKASKTLSEKDRKFVDTLKISADNLLEIINDLLDFAKIESSALELETVDFDLMESVRKVYSVVSVKAREKLINLNVHFAPTLQSHYVGDPLRIQQILTNLMSNAVKFTEKGFVELTVFPEYIDPQHSRVIFQVRDTGIGIAPDKMAGIFDKFVQADSSISRRYGGSGLGLSIVKALTERMQGIVTAESEIQKGTVFTVSLPLMNSGESTPIKPFNNDIMPWKSYINKNVLVVDDYKPNVLVTGSILEDGGFNYDVAHNGIEALSNFVSGRYDVILMDVQMHDLDGLETTRRIRRIESEKGLSRTPIIAMTAHVHERDKHICFDAGMDEFIAKPFDPADLTEKVSRFAQKREISSAN